MATAIVGFVFVLMQTIGLVFWALFLRLGLSWAKAEAISWRSVFRVAFVTQVVFLFIFGPVLMGAYKGGNEWELTISWGVRIAWTISNCWFISKVFELSGVRAFQAWATASVLQLIPMLVFAFAAKYFLWEAFSIPTNNMAPTVLGQHLRGECQTCGKTCCFIPQYAQATKALHLR
ncbi:MAG: hypothetical protein AAF497_01635 [Planctomycetota bacterium]